MAPAVATATASSTRQSRARSAPPGPPLPWWGEGAPPLELWPGVTIPFDVTWNIALSRWETHEGKYYFDGAAADQACRFPAEFLTHHIGEFNGQRFELMEYQKKLLTRVIFGWKKASTGTRRFRKVFAFLPKGAGKSPWGAATGLTCMVADQEAAAEIYAVAGDKAQARTVHDNARIMVQDSPDLSEVCEILRDSIVYLPNRSFFQVLSADASTKHGFRPHVVIFDEMHGQKNRSLYEALWRSMVKRRQPLMIIITHAGEDDENICFEEYEYAKGVLAGTIDDESTLPVIFELGPNEDFTDPDNWRKVNPGHGITVQHDNVLALCAEAKAEPRKLNDFLRYQCNRWVNQATAWIPVGWWDACNEPLPPPEELARYQCVFAIDMAQKIDLMAGVGLFRLPLAKGQQVIDIEAPVVDEETKEPVLVKRSLDYRLAIVPMFFLPEDTLNERVEQDNIRYDIYRDQGLLRGVPGAIMGSTPMVDYVRDEFLKTYPLAKQGEFAFDPAFATDVALALRDDLGLSVVEVRQNYNLSEACHAFEALIKAKRVIHGGNRLLRWNLENIAVKNDDAGRIRMVKPRKQTKRIDGIVASVSGLSRLMVMPAPRKKFTGFIV